MPSQSRPSRRGVTVATVVLFALGWVLVVVSGFTGGALIFGAPRNREQLAVLAVLGFLIGFGLFLVGAYIRRSSDR